MTLILTNNFDNSAGIRHLKSTVKLNSTYVLCLVRRLDVLYFQPEVIARRLIKLILERILHVGVRRDRNCHPSLVIVNYPLHLRIGQSSLTSVKVLVNALA